jgi:signal transduction histidine kinase
MRACATARDSNSTAWTGWAEGVHLDDHERCLDTYLTAFAGRQTFRTEYRLRRHDGEYRWVLDTGVPRFTPDGTFSGYIGSAIDITELKRVEQELQRVTGHLLNLQDDERRRLARELHDVRRAARGRKERRNRQSPPTPR